MLVHLKLIFMLTEMLINTVILDHLLSFLLYSIYHKITLCKISDDLKKLSFWRDSIFYNNPNKNVWDQKS